VLVGSYDGAVDHRAFFVGIACQVLKDALPDPGFGPATEPSMRVFQSPNRAGKSRHGIPARYRYKTASTKRRLSRAVTPTSPGLQEADL